ncbi:MFS transporter [Ligilactobacillus murinus]|jgi:MFS family permease|uniref:MFS transporter n=1 Tax=Ligilactobacillus murinus TaxID=1622 RepID=A0A2Z4W0K7_9LACO|nr:MFS transporter [Ligilactobacillus murinus]HAB49141.1 MFS transporter [Lactobacillus sp.]AWZ37634.1 MFS transporter [Ligilactobacillus murinus]AWZ41376.1 MFS transporter [Ligilactobacillus murinus]MBF0758704.1 MFS transporter [Ligilactobacillus murinus]MBF0832394.1 MFS transporter [Ligilactobacillus murinus]
MKEVSQKTGILMFFTLFAAYVTFAASWVGGSNLGPQIIQTYFGHEVSPVLSQVVNYTITIARVVANFLAALFLMKLGIKRAGQFALFLLSFSMVAIWMPNYWLYIIARMIMALGGSMIMVYMNPIVVRFVSREQKIFYSSFITASYNIGAFIMAIAFVFFADKMTHNWRLTLSCVAAFSIFFFIVWLLKAQNFETSGGSEVKNDYSYGKAVKDPFVWKFALGFGAFLFLYVMTLTSLPPTLANAYSNFKPGAMICAVSGGGMVGTLLMLKIKVERKRRPILLVLGSAAILAIAGAIFLAGISPLVAYTLLFISGIFLFSQYPIYLNIPHELPNMNPQKSTLLFGVIWALTYGFYTILNVIWSMILGAGGLLSANIFYIIVSMIYLVAIILLPETYRKK